MGGYGFNGFNDGWWGTREMEKETDTEKRNEKEMKRYIWRGGGGVS